MTLPLEPEPPLENGPPTDDMGALFRRLLALRPPPLAAVLSTEAP